MATLSLKKDHTDSKLDTDPRSGPRTGDVFIPHDTLDANASDGQTERTQFGLPCKPHRNRAG